MILAVALMSLAPQAEALEEVVVTAALRRTPLASLPASVSVLDAATLDTAGVQHLQDVLSLVPNLNWAAGTSRPRYFQLRGVGETEQWQGAPNPSVGLLIDDIDFSGLGMPATLFDVERVEVLQGPQGTVYGANALAGLISVRTIEASAEPVLRGQAGFGDYGMRSAGVVVGGAPGLGDVAARMAVQRFRSDGYTRNVTTGRRDTNGFDELTARARLRWQVTPQLTARLSLLHSELDNGYDAFAIDNSRVSLADDPGRDAQRSTGSALRIDYDGARPFKLQSISTAADSAIFYSFDGDWGADPTYDFTSRFVRSHRALSQDLRLLSRDDAEAAGAWLAGVYVLRVREDNDQLDLYNGDVFRALESRYAARNLAVYGEYIGRLRQRWTARLGLRSERRSADYSDSDGTRFSPAESMWGGHAVLDYRWAPGRMAYLSVSRGYKAGGVNIGAVVPQSRRGFGAELLMSIESGVKLRSADQRTELNVALFRMHRADQQVSTSLQLDPGDPLSFIYLTDNAARGVSYGLEASGGWAATPALQLEGSLGLLGTRLRGYEVAGRRLDGRDAAHAPRYQYRLSGAYRSPRGWFARADLQGVDAFYFSESHDQKSRPYTLLNLRAGFAAARWQASAWVRNAGNAHYSQRGFFFGNEPPGFPDKLYVQPGEPRVCGVSVDFSAR